MMETINGDYAIAWGAIEAGVSVVTGYPGSPGTGIFNVLSETKLKFGHKTQWCLNERIALDIAAGVSQGGKRSLVCLKSVGMNVALDTLMVLNMTGIHSGLVIIVGDDPGAWGSQNEQDTRFIAQMAELPMLEPSTLQEGREMVKWAFEYSEELKTIVIIRITRSFTTCREVVPPLQPPSHHPVQYPDRSPMRWIAALDKTTSDHKRLHQKNEKSTLDFSQLLFNSIESIENNSQESKGIIATGFVYTKLQEALDGYSSSLKMMKLNSLYPLPKKLVIQFLSQCEEILVFEEVDPYLEDSIKSIGYDNGHCPKLYGKRTGHVNWVGELFRWHIQQSLRNFLPSFNPKKKYLETNWEQEKPFRKPYCAGCPYIEILTTFREEAEKVGQNPFLIGDPGCVITAGKLLDTKLCMGSSIGVAIGHQSADVGQKSVAIFGDSAFYHSGINALIQARFSNETLLAIILDNGGSVTTGSQPTPDKKGVPIVDLIQTCQVDKLWIIEECDNEATMRSIFYQALSSADGLYAIVIRKKCRPV